MANGALGKSLRWLVCAASLVFGTVACEDTPDVVQDNSDCVDVCTRFAQCAQNSYDIGSCELRCNDKLEQDVDFSNTLSACVDCLGTHECDGAFDQCDTCDSVVP